MTDISTGETLFSEGKVEEAEKCFLDLLKKEPTNAEALNDLGVIQHAKGDEKKAEDLFLKAVAAKQEYLDARLNLVDLYSDAKRWSEAIAQLQECIQIDNKDPNLFNRLATYSLEMGSIEKARMALIKSLELNPDQETVRESMERLEKDGLAPSYLPTPGSFRGAFAEINITPDVSEQDPIFLQGMGGPPRKATAVSESLMMQLLLLEDDHFTKVFFVAADLFGFGPEIVDNVRTLVAQWGIEPEGLILNASHTHYAPGTISHASKSIGPFYSEYAKQIVQAIAQQLPILYAKLEECELSWGKADAQIGVSRRLKTDGKVLFAPNPEGYYERSTPFLMLHLLKADKKILLVNHSCHPTGLGSENVISSDYPGYMRNALKSNGGMDGVMFLQGGAGSTKEKGWSNGEVQFCEDATGVKENGEFLASQIINVINGFEKGLQPVTGSFFCTKRQITLPLKPIPRPNVLAQVRNNQDTDAMVREWANTFLNRFPRGDSPTTLAMEIQLISLGDKVSFVTLSGEPVAELARDLRGLLTNPDSTFVLGYTNGLVGYLPTDSMIEEGGYETELSHFVYLAPSPLNIGTETAVISSVKDCLKVSADKNNPNGYGRYHLAANKCGAFFVLSSGRCGTLALAHLLNTATNALVWHHPQPDPIQGSLLAYWGAIDKRKVFWKTRYPIIHKTWAQDLIHGETDLLMTPFCDMIADQIPDAKFIVLVRDPRGFVRSGMRRNYYHGHPWDFGRLRPREGTEGFEQWNTLDQFEKICWLWSKTYENIKEIASRIAKERVITVKFEDLIAGIEETKRIFNFLGLDGFDDRKIGELISHKFNAQVSGTFTKPEDWPAELNEKLWNLCGPIAKQLGYPQSFRAVTPNKSEGEAVLAGGKIEQPEEYSFHLVKEDLENREVNCVVSDVASDTIWDFKQFKHKGYPARIDIQLFKESRRNASLINAKTKITSMGSCFARNIAEYLKSKHYNYLVTEAPFKQASAHWDQVFNTACMRQIFEYTFYDYWCPLVRWWPRNKNVQDPFRRSIIYNKETCDLNFAHHREASYQALTEAEVIILTLGLIETWRDNRDQMTYYRVPSPRIYDSKIHEFYVQSVQDCLTDLNKIHGILQDQNPRAIIIITVSPVPMFASFRTDVDVVTANSLSKSTLRVAAEYLSLQHQNVYYFPAYEIVTQGVANPYDGDNRHVTKDAVDKVMEVFESQFVIATG